MPRINPRYIVYGYQMTHAGVMKAVTQEFATEEAAIYWLTERVLTGATTHAVVVRQDCTLASEDIPRRYLREVILRIGDGKAWWE